MTDKKVYPSLKPYFLRMYWTYINDQVQFPQILVDTTCPGLHVPTDRAKDNKLVINLSMYACKYLAILDTGITFEGRFDGVIYQCSIPMDAVLSVFSREDPSLFIEFGPTIPATPNSEPPAPVSKPPVLKIVK